MMFKIAEQIASARFRPMHTSGIPQFIFDNLSQHVLHNNLSVYNGPPVSLDLSVGDRREIGAGISAGGILLADRSFTDEQFVTLFKMLEDEIVHHINLSGCCIGDAGAVAVGEFLKVNRSLLSLNLDYSGITSVGANAIVTGLALNQSLRDLSLDGNCIGDIGKQAIAKALETKQSLQTLRTTDNNELQHSVDSNDNGETKTSAEAEAQASKTRGHPAKNNQNKKGMHFAYPNHSSSSSSSSISSVGAQPATQPDSAVVRKQYCYKAFGGL